MLAGLPTRIARRGIAGLRDCRQWVVRIANGWDCVAGGIAGRGIASHGSRDCVWRIVCVSSVVKKMNSESGLLGIAKQARVGAGK